MFLFLIEFLFLIFNGFIMMKNGVWDIRCTKELVDMFPKRTNYDYYLIDISMARRVCDTLSRAYSIATPNVIFDSSVLSYGKYNFKRRTILLHEKNRIRTVFHEFYHHLDNMTMGEYDSNDRDGRSTSLARHFSIKMLDEFKRMKKET